ncbi:MAG: hypothetical protein IJX30_01090 [Clostridia bacterium]|nr:hypothetical protein [Clostridia bacterium]
MKKKHLPRKETQVCRIRSLLLNINDGIEVTNIDYNIKSQEFNAYFSALEQEGYIKLIVGEQPYKVSSYIIVDLDKYNRLMSNAYKLIERLIVPIVVGLLEFTLTKT